MLLRFEHAGLGLASPLLAAYDERTNHAISVFLDTLPEETRADAIASIDDGLESSARAWHRMKEGNASPDPIAANEDDAASGSSLRQLGSIAPGLVLDAGAEDTEHPSAASRLPRVQSLSQIVDSVGAQGIKDHYEQSGASLDVDRLNDLQHHETNHSWL